MERIRGVSCDYAVRKLLEKDLVVILGRSKDPGRPLLYGTSEKFMQHFGLSSLKELPKLKEFKVEENQIGSIGDEEDL
jgi:segregation and condensation protein B